MPNRAHPARVDTERSRLVRRRRDPGARARAVRLAVAIVHILSVISIDAARRAGPAVPHAVLRAPARAASVTNRHFEVDERPRPGKLVLDVEIDGVGAFAGRALHRD